MVKNLLSFAALAALTVGAANAAEYELPLDQDLESWGGATYDVTTHTMNFERAWTGMGWTFWGEGDFSAYNAFVLEFEPTNIYIQVFVQTQVPEGEDPTNITVGANAGETSITVPLDAEVASHIGQVFVQPGAVGSVTIKKAYFQSDFEPSSILWEGEYTASAWNSGAEFASLLVKTGDILEYSATPGNDGTQVIMKGSDWKNLVGSAKFQNADIIDGVIEVVVTEEMITASGGKIFLQGEGGMTITKVEKVGTFEVKDGYKVLNAGVRALPTELYVNIPEGTEELVVAFDAKPEWIQICHSTNSTWESLIDNESATEVVEEEGVCMMTFPLTAEIIAAINEKTQMIYNGGAGANYIATFIKTSTGIQAIESVETEGPAVYYNLQGIQISNPVAGQMYIVKQGNKVSKIIK